jgi:hypothetical protein
MPKLLTVGKVLMVASVVVAFGAIPTKLITGNVAAALTECAVGALLLMVGFGLLVQSGGLWKESGDGR